MQLSITHLFILHLFLVKHNACNFDKHKDQAKMWHKGKQE